MTIAIGSPVQAVKAVAAVRVARYRATLSVIDEAHRRGYILAQEDAAALADRAIGEYFAQLGASEPAR